MDSTASGTATFTSWTEEPPHDSHPPVPRLAHAVVAFAYDGDLVATSTCHYVMAYGSDGECAFTGFEEVDGRLCDLEGSFVLRHEGTFGAAGLDVAWAVNPGSGTGDLTGISGTGGYQVGAGDGEIDGEQRWRWALDFNLPATD